MSLGAHFLPVEINVSICTYQHTSILAILLHVKGNLDLFPPKEWPGTRNETSEQAVCTVRSCETVKFDPGLALPIRCQPSIGVALALVSCPAHVCLPARNGLVNKVEFLGLITQNR